ncbi:hypothetical protein [Streptomyces sp. NPDC096934]|uniref:hypothetical protein n=1 Tax=Streptomyces sp. NPDC096934 TaxID=3155551 RepID=UPI00331CC45F
MTALHTLVPAAVISAESLTSGPAWSRALTLAVTALQLVFPQESQHRLAWWTNRRTHHPRRQPPPRHHRAADRRPEHSRHGAPPAPGNRGNDRRNRRRNQTKRSQPRQRNSHGHTE